MELFWLVYSNKNFEAQFGQNVRTSNWGSNPEKLRTFEAKPNFTGSYKKKLCRTQPQALVPSSLALGPYSRSLGSGINHFGRKSWLSLQFTYWLISEKLLYMKKVLDTRVSISQGKGGGWSLLYPQTLTNSLKPPPPIPIYSPPIGNDLNAMHY